MSNNRSRFDVDVERLVVEPHAVEEMAEAFAHNTEEGSDAGAARIISEALVSFDLTSTSLQPHYLSRYMVCRYHVVAMLRQARISGVS